MPPRALAPLHGPLDVPGSLEPLDHLVRAQAWDVDRPVRDQGPEDRGESRILPPALAWHYRSRKSATRDGRPERGATLIVADVSPPPALGLASLPVELEARDATVLRGAEATPRQVLARMAGAATIEVHVHGLIGSEGGGGPALALSPDADGAYLLSAERIAHERLVRRPLVLLAACDAGRSSGGPEGWGLTEAFLEAGARAVIAAPSTVRNVGAGAVFAALRRRIDAGESPAAALRTERIGRAAESPWIVDLVVFVNGFTYHDGVWVDVDHDKIQ